MAGNYGAVDNAVWKHPDFKKGLTDDEKLVWLYMKTCEHGNMIGCFHLPLVYIVEDLNWQDNGYDKGLERVKQTLEQLLTKGFARVDLDIEYVLLPKHFLKHPAQNPNQAKSAISLFNEVPKRFKFINDLSKILNGCETVKKQLANSSLTLATETETETETNKPSFEGEPKEFIWTEALKFSGVTRTYLGKLCKEYSEDELVKAILRTREYSPADPKSFLIGCLKDDTDDLTEKAK